jgi:hypothetical protein
MSETKHNHMGIRQQVAATRQSVRIHAKPGGWPAAIEALIVEASSQFGAPLHAEVRASVGPFKSTMAVAEAVRRFLEGEHDVASAVLGVATS